MIEDIEILLEHLKQMKRMGKRIEKLQKSENLGYEGNCTQRRLDKIRNDLNYDLMHFDQARHKAHALAVNCGFAMRKKEYGTMMYNPDAWHGFKFQIPEPK